MMTVTSNGSWGDVLGQWSDIYWQQHWNLTEILWKDMQLLLFLTTSRKSLKCSTSYIQECCIHQESRKSFLSIPYVFLHTPTGWLFDLQNLRLLSNSLFPFHLWAPPGIPWHLHKESDEIYQWQDVTFSLLAESAFFGPFFFLEAEDTWLTLDWAGRSGSLQMSSGG